MWLLPGIACLLLIVSEVKTSNNIQLSCFDKLGHQRSAYHIESSNQTLLSIGHIAIDYINQEICLKVLPGTTPSSKPDGQLMYCGKSVSNNTMEVVWIPLSLQGLVTIQIDVYNTTTGVYDMPKEENVVELFQSHTELYYVNTLSTVSSSSLSSSLSSSHRSPPHSSMIYIESPSYGTIHSDYEFVLSFTPDLYTMSHVVEYIVDIKGLTTRRLESNVNFINSYRVEPASWFIDITPIFYAKAVTAEVSSNSSGNQFISATQSSMAEQQLKQPERIEGYAAKGYIEFVLSDANILRERVFADDWKKAKTLTEQQQQCNQSSCMKEGGDNGNRRDINSSSYSVNDNQNDSTTTAIPENGATNYHKPQQQRSNVHICIWGSNKMDGQKSIWLQQIQHLNHHHAYTSSNNNNDDEVHTRFSFTWVLTTDMHNDRPGSVRHRLQQLQALYTQQQQQTTDDSNNINSSSSSLAHVNVVNSPLDNNPIAIADLNEELLDGTPPVATLWNDNVSYLYQYMSKRLRANHYNITTLTPHWAQKVYRLLYDNMKENHCDVVVYGNDRGLTADVLIRDTAAALNIPTAVELLNLFIDADMLPTVLIAPSHYAMQHESIQSALRNQSIAMMVANNNSTNNNHNYSNNISDRVKASANATSSSINSTTASATTASTRVVVISPGVDLATFNHHHYSRRKNDSAVNDNNAISHYINNTKSDNSNDYGNKVFSYDKSVASLTAPIIINNNNNIKTIINIGFIARLAPEKSPGLFLQMAAILLEQQQQQNDDDSDYQLRFTIVGDGPLRQLLQELTERLNISSSHHHIDVVHFAGWVDAQSQLPQVIAMMDIVVNPSLRGWSETFCIANIEVMAMSVPLVTFGVGGVGEYVDGGDDDTNDNIGGDDSFENSSDSGNDSDNSSGNVNNSISNYDDVDDIDIFSVISSTNDGDHRCISVNNTNEDCSISSNGPTHHQANINSNNSNKSNLHSPHRHFTVTSNAVLVHTATPLALADTVYHLLINPSLRHEIGVAGRKTVEAYFTMERQMKQYRALYTQMVNATHTHTHSR